MLNKTKFVSVHGNVLQGKYAKYNHIKENMGKFYFLLLSETARIVPPAIAPKATPLTPRRAPEEACNITAHPLQPMMREKIQLQQQLFQRLT